MKGRRYIFVGDVHGCFEELQNLLDVVGFCETDVLVSVGDLVRKGRSSAEVVSFFRSLGERGLAVIGNHEEIWLAQKSRGGAKKAPKMTPEDWQWLADLPTWRKLPGVADGEDILVVHAGLEPWLPLEGQQRDVLLNVRFVNVETREWFVDPPSPLHGAVRWGSVYDGSEGLVIYGHDASGALREFSHAIGLDSGCVNGKFLTALIYPGRKWVSVPATRRTRHAAREKKHKQKLKKEKKMQRKSSASKLNLVYWILLLAAAAMAAVFYVS